MVTFEQIVKEYPSYEEAIGRVSATIFWMKQSYIGCPQLIDVINKDLHKIINDAQYGRKFEDYSLCSCFPDCRGCWTYCLRYAYCQQTKLE